MYGFCSDGLSPTPSTGASWVTNGLAGTTSSTRKNAPINARIMISQGCNSPSARCVARSASRLKAERIVTHKSSEPA